MSMRRNLMTGAMIVAFGIGAEVGCVAAVAGGAAVGASEANRQAEHEYGLKQVPGPDGHVMCRIRCRRNADNCYNAAIDVCKTTWTGDQSAESIPSDNPLIARYEMVIECSPPVKTAEVCR